MHLSLKPGIRIRVYKRLETKDYSFVQIPESETASVLLRNAEGTHVNLNLNFDPSGVKKNMWGYPPSYTQLTIKEWSQHAIEAANQLENAGGLLAFSKLGFEKHFFDHTGTEIQISQAYLAPGQHWTDTIYGQTVYKEIFDAFDFPELAESDLEPGTYTNAQIAKMCPDVATLRALLRGLPGGDLSSKRSILSFAVDLLPENQTAD